MKVIRRHWIPLAALFVLNLVIFARLVFLRPDGVPYATIPFDFASAYSPWLVYIGDCFASGFFPLWSPYVGGGTPFFINPQNQLYSPVTLLVASTLGYTQRVTQLQSVLTLFFGGAGAYALSYTLWRSRWAGLFTAICFNFTSAVYGNLQHSTFMTGAALVPWLLWSATLTAREGRAWGYPLLTFFVYFLVTSGYPGNIPMALLWLTAYTAYLILRRPVAAPAKLGLALRHGLGGLLGLGLAAVHWIPIVIHRKEFTRGAAPLSLEAALLGGNLSFKHLWGMLFQFMTDHSPAGTETDISMRGVYFGALALPLAVAALLWVKDEIVPALLVGVVGAFLMACGGQFFGRVFLHISFPVLNMSRFPASDSRSLMVLGVAVLAGGGVTLLQAGAAGARSFLARACVVLLGALVLGLFAFRAVLPAQVYDDVVVNFVTAEIFFVSTGLLLLHVFSGGRLLAGLAALLVLQVGTGVLANPKVVGARVGAAADYAAARARHRRVFTPEAAGVPRIADGAELVSEESGWGYVQKNFYLSEYNPLRLNRFDALIRNGFAGWMTTGARVVALPPDAWPGDFESFSRQARPVEHSILSYTPNEVVYRVRADADVMLVFNEVYFPGWRARVDGARQPVSEVAGGLRALRVGAGEHTVVTYFRPKSFYWGLGVSLVSAAIFLLWVALLLTGGRRAGRARSSPRPAC